MALVNPALKGLQLAHTGTASPCLRSALELGPVLGGEQALPLPVQLPLLLLQVLPLVPQADNEPLHPLGHRLHLLLGLPDAALNKQVGK